MFNSYIFSADFLFSGELYPIKAEENLNAKSLKYFVERSGLPFGVRIPMSDYRTQEKLINLPLYAVSCLWAVCDMCEND